MIKPSKMRWVDRPPKRVATRKAGGVCRLAKNTGGGGGRGIWKNFYVGVVIRRVGIFR